MRRYLRALTGLPLLLAAALAALPARAADVFSVTVTVAPTGVSVGGTASRGFSSAQDALDQFKSGALNALIPSYTTSSIARGTVDFRGVTVSAAYLTTGTALDFRVPAAGVHEVFTGATRDASQQLLVDYLKKNNNYARILRALIRSSPVEPLAGNPSSLMSQMVGHGFASAFGTNAGAPGTTVNPGSRIGVGLNYGHFTQSSLAVDALTLPLSHTIRFEADPRYALQFDLPLTYVNVQGASAAAASFGVGLTVPLTDQWSVTPRVAYGLTGSLDLASVGSLVTGSVTSAYRLRLGEYGLVIGNMVGIANSLPVSFGSFSVDPKLTNTYIKNGVMFAIPSPRLGLESGLLAETELQLFVTDTRFFGSRLYEENMQEVGFSFGTTRASPYGDGLKIGASYLHGRRSSGFTLNFGFRF